MGLFEFVVGRINMLATSQFQPRLSSITNVSPDGSTNQLAVFISN